MAKNTGNGEQVLLRKQGNESYCGCVALNTAAPLVMRGWDGTDLLELNITHSYVEILPLPQPGQQVLVCHIKLSHICGKYNKYNTVYVSNNKPNYCYSTFTDFNR